MNILLLSAHLFESKNRAGFHHLAHAYKKLGHSVYFCTVPNTVMHFMNDLLTNPNRFLKRFFSLITTIFPKKTEGVTHSTYFSLICNTPKYHSFPKLKSWFFLCGYSILLNKKNYDVIIVESSVALLLIPKLKIKYPKAQLIYRVSDNLNHLKADPLLLAKETAYLSEFACVSTPVESITKTLKKRCQTANIMTQYHGIDTHRFDTERNNKSLFESENNAVYVGIYKSLDNRFFDIASRAYPGLTFHIIGPYKQEIKRDNVQFHGLIPFEETIKYIVHADIGVFGMDLEEVGGQLASDFSKSLKVIQYTYCKMPIVAHKNLATTDPHIFLYDYTDNSIRSCISKALSYDRTKISTSWIKNWTEVASELIASK